MQTRRVPHPSPQLAWVGGEAKLKLKFTLVAPFKPTLREVERVGLSGIGRTRPSPTPRLLILLRSGLRHSPDRHRKSQLY